MVYLSLLLISLASFGGPIGQCHIEEDTLLVNFDHGLVFTLKDSQGNEKKLDPNFGSIFFKEEFIRPWSEINIAYYKYREGREGTGMFSFDRISGDGHLRFFVKPHFYYVDLKSCQIDETKIILP